MSGIREELRADAMLDSATERGFRRALSTISGFPISLPFIPPPVLFYLGTGPVRASPSRSASHHHHGVFTAFYSHQPDCRRLGTVEAAQDRADLGIWVRESIVLIGLGIQIVAADRGRRARSAAAAAASSRRHAFRFHALSPHQLALSAAFRSWRITLFFTPTG